MVKNTIPGPGLIPAYFIESPLLKNGNQLFYRVKAYGPVGRWIEQQAISLWKYDDDDAWDSGLALRSRYMLMPELVTLLQLRWG